MPKFLSVKEAASFTGKSPSSIRRIIYPILKEPKHPDRKLIEPSEKEAKALRLKGENFPWKVSDALINREIPEGQSKKTTASKSTTAETSGGSAAVVQMLQRELEIKNKQIETQNELLKGLSERLREGNILMGSLQQRLALTDGSSRTKKAVDADQSTDAEKDGSARPSEKKSKMNWLFKKIF